jgi:hypothetical protein
MGMARRSGRCLAVVGLLLTTALAGCTSARQMPARPAPPEVGVETELRPQVRPRQQAGRRNAARQAPASHLGAWLRDLPLRAAALPLVTRILQRQFRLHR